MDNKADADIEIIEGDYYKRPNEEMRFSSDIREAIEKLESIQQEN
jgi:hypothetical protein